MVDKDYTAAVSRNLYSRRTRTGTTFKALVSAAHKISLIANLFLFFLLVHLYLKNHLDKVLDEDNYPISAPKHEDNYSISAPKQRDFYSIAVKTETDKVMAVDNIACIKDKKSPWCTYPKAINERCRPWGHFYHTIYQRWLGPLSTADTEPFQFLEIGYYQGSGYDAFRKFMPQGQGHTIEISCEMEASENKRYKKLLKNKLIHCGNAARMNFLHKTWSSMKSRTDAAPLKVVIDDGSHNYPHMALSVFFWFPRLQPRGLLIVEDIQPIDSANKFRTHFIPQVMSDLHFCGGAPGEYPELMDQNEDACFPQLWPFLASVHCEMHICVFERNDKPAMEPNAVDEVVPKGAFDLTTCKSMMNRKG